MSGESLFSLALFRFYATQYCVLHFTTRVRVRPQCDFSILGRVRVRVIKLVHNDVRLTRDLGNAEWHNIVRKKLEYISWKVYVALFH